MPEPRDERRQTQARALAHFVRDTLRRLDDRDPQAHPNAAELFLYELSRVVCLHCGRTDHRAAGCQCWNDE